MDKKAEEIYDGLRDYGLQEMEKRFQATAEKCEKGPIIDRKAHV